MNDEAPARVTEALLRRLKQPAAEALIGMFKLEIFELRLGFVAAVIFCLVMFVISLPFWLLG
jgi:hypothetical protein